MTPDLIIAVGSAAGIGAVAMIAALIVRNRKPSRKSRNYPFPVKLLALSALLTLADILWSSGNGFYIDYRIRQDIGNDLAINDMGGQIAYLDTVINEALKLAVTSGDPKWKTAYEDNVRHSNEIVERLKAATDNQRDAGIHGVAERIDKSTDFFLDASEKKALELAQNGKADEARALLDGPEYTARKQDYSDDVHKLAQDTTQALAHTLQALARTVTFSLYLGLIVIAILPTAWFLSYRSIRRWREELEKARKTLVANELELQRFIGEIEMSQTAAMKAQLSAERSSAAKSEFLANMSHELRTPLNSILGMLRLLKEGDLPPEEHGLAVTAFGSSTNLLEIINDILDLSKIEAGEMQLERIGMDLDYALDSVILMLGNTAREKHLSLARQGDRSFPYVLGDPTRFARVLTNLIGNAIKYTDHGQVEVSATALKPDDAHIEFRCAITDTGIGIPADKLQNIFEKFVQADSSTTRKYGGTGLGLAITKQLIELMGGAIGVESAVGVGSTFWFRIAFEITDRLNEDKTIRRGKLLCGTLPAAKARILVAEDHPMNQILMTKLLQRFGIDFFEIAEDGMAALQRYDEAPWDVILMDCHMPEMNGYDTTLAIREREKDTPVHVPIVAMTANAMIGDREKCLRCGMDEYISKPVNIDELKEVLGQWIDFGNGAGPDQAAIPASAASPAEAPVDPAILAAFSEGDIDMEKELIAVYVAQSDKNLQALSEHCAAAGAAAWREAAHMLKGGSAGIGAKALAQLCHDAQHFTGAAPEQTALFAQIAAEYDRVRDHLRRVGLLA